MKCPEIAPLVSRFFDGELDGCHMRTVALHITRCSDCEGELRTLERIQGLVAGFVADEVAAVDVDSIWAAVSSRIGDQGTRSWSQRLWAWGEDFELFSPAAAWPALAAAVALVLAFNFWPAVDVAKQAGVEIVDKVAQAAELARAKQVAHADRLVEEAMDQIDNIDNSAVFESIVGGVDSFMVEPKTQTAVLWINDDSGDFR